MGNKKVVIAGGGVLGTQIGLICAYHGFDTTFWLRSESSIGRTTPKIERYSALMLEDLAKAKALIGNPIGGMLYPRGLIRSWQGITAEAIDALIAEGKKNFAEKVHIELDLKKALSGAYLVIESMTEDPKAKIGMYEAMRDLLDEDTILCTNSSTLLPSMFAQYTGRPVPDSGHRRPGDGLQHQPDETGRPAGRHPGIHHGQALKRKDRPGRNRCQRRQGLLRLQEAVSFRLNNHPPAWRVDFHFRA